MYQDLKLEKGMYHITGKSFSEVLEGINANNLSDIGIYPA